MVVSVEDGFTGMAAELAIMALARAGYDTELEIAPWVRAVYMAETGDADALFYASRTPEREKVFHYPELPLFTVEIVALKRAGSKLVINSNYSGLSDNVLGVGRGFAYGPKSKELIQRAHFKEVQTTASNDLNFEKLLDRRIDMLLVDKALARFFMEKPGAVGKSDYVRDSEGAVVVLDSLSVYLVFSKATMTADDAVRLNQALKSMQDDGSFQEVINRYQ